MLETKETYNFDTLISYYGAATYRNLKLISKGTYDSIMYASILPVLESLRPALPESLKEVNWLEETYLTFQKTVLDTNGSPIRQTLVIPEILIVNVVAVTTPMKITVTVDNVEDLELVTSTLTDLNITHKLEDT